MQPNVVDLPEDRIVHTIFTPGFSLAAPEIVHPELIPPPLMQALAAQWARVHDGHVVTFHSVPDVFVVGEGIVFDRSLNLLAASRTQHSAATIQAARQALIEANRSATVPSHKGPLLLCGKAGLNNYGHWLAEMLPLVYLSRQWLLAEGGWRVLVPQVYPWMANVIDESLSLLGVDAAKRLLNDGRPCHVQELVMVNGLTQHGTYFSPLVIEAMDAVAAQIEPAPDQRLWISRAHDPRRLIDEETVNQRIADLGWRVVHPGQMGFRAQVAAAKGARHMAGVNGAGLANLVFMRPGGTVTSFVPSVMPDIFYWQFSGHRGLTYRETRSGLRDDVVSETGWDAPLTIPVDEVLATLSRVAALCVS